MSVVNSMLRNLDERQLASAQVVPLREGLPEEVKATRDQPLRLRPSVLIATIAVVAVVAGTLYFYQPKPARLPVPVTFPVETASTRDASLAGIVPSNKAPGLVDSQPLAAPDKPAGAAETVETSPAAKIEKRQPVTVSSSVAANKSLSMPERNLALAVSLETTQTLVRSLTAPPSRKAVLPSGPAPLPTPTASADPIAIPALATSSKIVVEQAAVPPAQNEVQRALDLQRRGMLVEAEAALRAVLNDDKGMVEARQALITLLARQQRDDEVRKLLQEGVAVAPTQPAMVMQYARLLAGHSEWKAAADVLAPASSALARDAEYRALYGAVLQRLGRFSQSVEAYQAALRIAPGVGAWWVGMGLSLESDGRLAEARDAYQQARQRDTLSPDLSQFVESKLAHLP